jgi:aminotransferase
MWYLSETAINYPRSGIRVMFDLAAQHSDAINLCVGEPNFDTPNHIIESAKKALDMGMTHYTSNSGIFELRQAIADKYTYEFNENYCPENVIVTVGGMEALFLSLSAIINPGDEIIVPDPAYPNYLGQIKMLGGKVVNVPLYEEHGFKLQPEDLEKAITPKTKALVINSPSNPIGCILEKEDLEALAKVVEKHNMMVISDEVYEKIMFDNHVHYSMAQVPEVRDKVIIINSLSKTYAMTGWRLGYVVANKELISNMPKLQEGLVSCAPTFIQEAAIEAITGPQESLQEMIKHYKRRRDLFINGLNEIPGFKCIKTAGSFYAFPNIKAFGKTSKEFAYEILREAGVVGVPGSAFGEMGEGYLRFSFANSDEKLKEAVERIARYIKSKY